jgi:hypothetical protein
VCSKEYIHISSFLHVALYKIHLRAIDTDHYDLNDVKFNIMKFSTESYDIIPHEFKYSPKHPVLEHPQPMIFHYGERPSFIAI